MRSRRPELRIRPSTRGLLTGPLPLRTRLLPWLPALRRELLLLMLPVRRQLLRPLRSLGLLRVLAGLALRLLRLVLGHVNTVRAGPEKALKIRSEPSKKSVKIP
jgi:hypothetical protein